MVPKVGEREVPLQLDEGLSFGQCAYTTERVYGREELGEHAEVLRHGISVEAGKKDACRSSDAQTHLTSSMCTTQRRDSHLMPCAMHKTGGRGRSK